MEKVIRPDSEHSTYATYEGFYGVNSYQFHQMTDFSEKTSRTSACPAVAHALIERGWLSERPEGFRTDFLSVARVVRFGAGETIFHMEDKPTALFGIATGSVRVSLPADNGETFVIHQTRPPFWCGELAAFSDQNRLISLTTSSDVVALRIGQSDLVDMVNRHPEYCQDFYALTRETMQTALKILANQTIANSEHRLAFRLLHFSDLMEDPTQWLDISQGELADMIAVSPATLQRSLRRFAQAGFVEVGYGKIRVTDRERLIAFCRD